MNKNRRRKLSEEGFAEAENENNSISNYDFKNVHVPLSAIRHQIGRILECFIIIQFTVGAFIFFTGIFLLSWAVTPGTAFRAASYMLLAGLIIGRSLLGLVGLHPGRSGPLFAYGSLLMCTCVLRTIMILVLMKILMGAENFRIPALLSAAPGAQSPIIELICAIIEASQALCAFYVAWIIDKQSDAERDYNDQQLEAVLINLRALQKRRHQSVFSRRLQTSGNLAKNHLTINLNKHETIKSDVQTNTHSNQQPSQAEIDYFAVYKRYPRNTPTPSVSKSPKPTDIEQAEIEEEKLEEVITEKNNNNRSSEVKLEEKIPNKRQLPKRPYTLDYALPKNDIAKYEHEQNHQPLAIQESTENYYPQYRESYSYYDTVTKTSPEKYQIQFETYSQTNSPLIYDNCNHYGATLSRMTNEFDYRSFNHNYS